MTSIFFNILVHRQIPWKQGRSPGSVCRKVSEFLSEGRCPSKTSCLFFYKQGQGYALSKWISTGFVQEPYFFVEKKQRFPPVLKTITHPMNRYLFSLPLFLFSSLIIATPVYPDSLQAAALIEQSVAKANSNRDSSLLLFQMGLNFFKKNNDLKSWVDACKKLGVEFDMAGDLATALSVYQIGTREKLFRQPANREEWQSLGWLYTNAGYTLFWYGKFYEAKPWYEEARRIFEDEAKFVDVKVAAYVFRELGNLYTRFGDFEAALLLLGQVKKTALQHGDFNLAAEACNDIGIVHFDRGEDSLAVKVCREALGFSGLNEISKGLLESTLAHVFFDRGEKNEALAHTLRSLRAFEFVSKNELHPSAKIWLAQAHQLAGDLDTAPGAAEQHFQTSLKLMREYFPDTLRREFAKLRLSMAHHFASQNRMEEALAQQQTALRSVLYRFNENDPMANPLPAEFYPENVIMEALGSKAETYRQRYGRERKRVYLEKSLECHDLIFEAERAYRQVHHFESSKLATVAESSRRTESALAAAWQFYRDFNDEKSLEQAFVFTEKSKGTLLFEALRHSDASSIANIPPKILQQEKQLKDELASKEKSLYLESRKGEKSNPEVVESLGREVFSLNADLAALTRQIEENYPAFFEMKYRQRAVSVAETQALLRPGQAVVEYFVGDSTIFIFLIKKDAFHVERVKKDFPLEQWVTQFRQGIEAFQFSNSNRDSLCRTYTELAQALYQKLLKPIEKQGLPRDLMIVPGGILGFLPFDALLYEAPPAPCVFKKYPYLARRHNISYNYSSTLFKELLQEKKQVSTSGFAGLAPEFAEGNTSGFGPLKFNISSVEEIAAMWGGDPFVRSAASGDNFMKNATGHSVLYLATHAKANTDEGGFSFIVLAGEGGGYDTIFVKDIYNLPLSADLVFLGACETGSGRWYNGEGIISLARSFLYAGARSIVTTLWSINDESNKNLTVRFFKHLYDGERKDEALWHAKREQLAGEMPDLYAHPVYWAAYTPIGNMEPVRKHGNWWYAVAGAGLLGVAFFSVKKCWGLPKRGELAANFPPE